MQTTTPATTPATNSGNTNGGDNTNSGNTGNSGGDDSGNSGNTGSSSSNNNGGSNSGSKNNNGNSGNSNNNGGSNSGSSSSNNNNNNNNGNSNNNGGSNSGSNNNGDSDGTDNTDDDGGDDIDDTVKEEIDPSEISPEAFDDFIDSEFVTEIDTKNIPCDVGNIMHCTDKNSPPEGLFNQQEFNGANFGQEFYDEYLSVDGQVPVTTPDGKLINKDNFIASGCIAVSVLGQAVRNIERLREEGFDVPPVTMAHIKYAIHVAINTPTPTPGLMALGSDGYIYYAPLIRTFTMALMVGCDNCDGVNVQGNITMEEPVSTLGLNGATQYAIVHAGRGKNPHAYTAHGDGTFHDPYHGGDPRSYDINLDRGSGQMRFYHSTLTFPSGLNIQPFKQTIRKVPIGTWYQLYFKKEESTVIL